jgi:hypothetical protein
MMELAKHSVGPIAISRLRYASLGITWEEVFDGATDLPNTPRAVPLAPHRP